MSEHHDDPWATGKKIAGVGFGLAVIVFLVLQPFGSALDIIGSAWERHPRFIGSMTFLALVVGVVFMSKKTKDAAAASGGR